jgi:hypothetical protein
MSHKGSSHEQQATKEDKKEQKIWRRSADAALTAYGRRPHWQASERPDREQDCRGLGALAFHAGTS